MTTFYQWFQKSTNEARKVGLVGICTQLNYNKIAWSVECWDLANYMQKFRNNVTGYSHGELSCIWMYQLLGKTIKCRSVWFIPFLKSVNDGMMSWKYLISSLFIGCTTYKNVVRMYGVEGNEYLTCRDNLKYVFLCKEMCWIYVDRNALNDVRYCAEKIWVSTWMEL